MKSDQLQKAMRIMMYIGFEEFRKVFDHMPEQWCEEKFMTYLSSNRTTYRGPAEFMGALDNSNMKVLYQYLMSRMEEKS